MSYINTTTLAYPISDKEIASQHPDTVPTPLDGYAWVFPTPSPTYDSLRESVIEVAPVLTIKDTWEQQWNVIDLSPEQIAANIEAKRIAAIPAAVSPRQIRQALTRVNLRSAVEDAIASGDQDIKDWYEFATTFERNNEHVIEMAELLSITERQLDDLFTLAGTL